MVYFIPRADWSGLGISIKMLTAPHLASTWAGPCRESAELPRWTDRGNVPLTPVAGTQIPSRVPCLTQVLWLQIGLFTG